MILKIAKSYQPVREKNGRVRFQGGGTSASLKGVARANLGAVSLVEGLRKARPRMKLSHGSSPYRLELLPVVLPYHRRARRGKELSKGQLVYYGPMPSYYGIGEVKHVLEGYVAVDFRGTGHFGVHEDVMEQQYLIPIPSKAMQLL